MSHSKCSAMLFVIYTRRNRKKKSQLCNLLPKELLSSSIKPRYRDLPPKVVLMIKGEATFKPQQYSWNIYLFHNYHLSFLIYLKPHLRMRIKTVIEPLGLHLVAVMLVMLMTAAANDYLALTV